MTTDNPYQSPVAEVAPEPVNVGEVQLRPARRVKAGRGASWFGDAFAATARGTPGWVLFAIVFILAYVPMAAAPYLPLGNEVVVQIVVSFFGTIPIALLWGGAMAGCHADRFSFVRAWRGMWRSWRPLAVMGLLMAVLTLPGMLILGAVGFLDVDPAASGSFDNFSVATWVIVIVGMLAYYSLLSMALWMAPALITLGGMGPVPAMMTSLRAAFKNTLAFLVYGLVVLGAGIAMFLVLGIAAAVVMGVTGMAASLAGGGNTSSAFGGMVIIGILYVAMYIGVLGVLYQSQYATFMDVFAYDDAA
ncbi:MAG: hypothetical protein AAFU65_01515 [Pseudomonadota bacterium]